MIWEILVTLLRVMLPALIQASRPKLVESAAPGTIEDRIKAKLKSEGWL